MDEYMLHKEYYKSIRGEDGEEPLAVHGSRPRTDLGSYAHSGPPSTASLPIHILFLLYLLLWFGFSTTKPAGIHETI